MTALDETTETDPVVLRDGFPATVTLGGQLVGRTVRVAITRERVYVWTAEGRTGRLVLSAPYDAAASVVPRYNAPRGHRATLTVPDGQLVVERQRGCGCSNPLARWRPWQPYRIAA